MSELRNIHHVLTDQFELLKGIDKEIEDIVDISNIEAAMEEVDVYVCKIILAKVKAKYKIKDALCQVMQAGTQAKNFIWSGDEAGSSLRRWHRRAALKTGRGDACPHLPAM